MGLPAWVLAIFLLMAAAVPAGVYFTAQLIFGPVTYTYSGPGTYHGAPGPVAGVGLPFLAAAYGTYWLIRRRRKSK